MAQAKFLCVGLDVSSRCLEVGFCDGSGAPVGRVQSSPNDAAGAAALCKAVVAAPRTMGRGTQVMAALESTSEYHRVAAEALRSETRRAIQVHALNPREVKRVIALAKAAPMRQLPPMARLSIQDVAARILQLNRFIHGMDAAIAEEPERIFPHNVLRSIPGLGAVSVASILAEVGDVRRFPDKETFVGYCGLYPVAWESGDTKLRFRMTRKGNRMLKITLLVASAACRQYNPAILHFYGWLRTRGKTKKAAGGAIARKMAEIVWAVLTSNQPWSEEIALRGIAKGEDVLQGRQGERRLSGDAAGQTPTESGRHTWAAPRSCAPQCHSTMRAGRSKSHFRLIRHARGAPTP